MMYNAKWFHLSFSMFRNHLTSICRLRNQFRTTPVLVPAAHPVIKGNNLHDGCAPLQRPTLSHGLFISIASVWMDREMDIHTSLPKEMI